MTGNAGITMNYFWKIVGAVIALLIGTAVLLTTKSVLWGTLGYGLGYLVPSMWLGIFDWWVFIFYVIGAVLLLMLTQKWTSSSII
jgi:uncharacterized membrane protein YeaQ/YmgE (transglycosylase-associated protein family)